MQEITPTLLRAALASAVLVALAACSAPTSDAGEASSPSEPPATAPAADVPLDRLTAEEVADGWQLLFDGESLDQWRGYEMEGIPAGWTVDEGTIHFVPPTEGPRADLITKAEFADFELALEWAISPGGNSGIFFRVSEDADQTYYTGPEMQVLDNAGHPDGQKPETSAGSNYALHAPVVDATRPVGEFNSVRIRVEGAHVTHWLNEQKLLEYDLWSDDWKARVAASKFAAMPGYGLNKTGHIALQDHGNEVWYRNLRIKVLE